VLRLSIGISAAICFAATAPAITQAVDESKLVALPGNVRPEASAQNDRGRVDDSLPLDHLLLQLHRSPELEAAAQEFLDSQQDRQSPNYHKWITAAEFGERFGVSPRDVEVVTRWLGTQGFAVNQVHPNGMLIDFSGTAGQVREAFHTEIHNLDVGGTRHIANMSDPRIPAALAPVVEGVVSLHDFMPHALNRPHAGYTFTSGGDTYQALVPGDLATIYNFKQAYAAKYTGAGQTIVVLEDSNVYSTSDFTTFRSTFGLAAAYPSGSLTQVHPTSSGNACSNPGTNSDDVESEIDVEWASAAAPNAAIELASCADTATNFGGFIAFQNLLAGSTPPAIVSISYGESEAQNGAAGNAYINSLYETAAAEGVSVFVSAGDEGAASSDAGADSATHGITVSAYASTPYNVAVGGTDFADGYEGDTSTYWSSTNGTYFNSALSYIPEIPWNFSCGSQLIATALGFSTTYGSSGLCASSTASEDGLLQVVAGSGGPSNCATGAPAQSGIAGGTCAGYSKPSWQKLYGNPADGVRDIPDVAMFASNGVWGHYYVVCYSDPGRNRGGAPCTGAPSGWAGFGGTSVSSPVMAAVQALINERTGARQGNPNPNLYALARSEYGSGGNGSCNSSGAAACAFHDVTLGDMDVNCSAGSADCYDPGASTSGGGHGHHGFGHGGGSSGGGVLSTSTSSYEPAYGTAPGWDFATGIGSVNVYLLITNWP
jgi:subtilase family serine protease